MKTDCEKTIFDFLDYENVGLKNRRIRIVPKGLVHGFGKKFESLSTFRFMQTDTEKK